jgi:hypothetical protein
MVGCLYACFFHQQRTHQARLLDLFSWDAYTSLTGKAATGISSPRNRAIAMSRKRVCLVRNQILYLKNSQH